MAPKPFIDHRFDTTPALVKDAHQLKRIQTASRRGTAASIATRAARRTSFLEIPRKKDETRNP